MALGLRQLRYFIAIADAGVLSRAAEALNVAQSALSHHIAALETDLGVKLLERKPRGIALTARRRPRNQRGGKQSDELRSYLSAFGALAGGARDEGDGVIRARFVATLR